MNNKIVWAVIIIVIIGAGGWYYSSKSSVPQDIEGINSSMPVPGTSTAETVVTKEFMVDGKDFSFSPASMTVNKGDQVKITLKNTGGFHDLIIEGYGVGTERIQAGGETSVTFTADKTGSFEYYCSVGEHRAKGMKGTLVVQ